MQQVSGSISIDLDWMGRVAGLNPDRWWIELTFVQVTSFIFLHVQRLGPSLAAELRRLLVAAQSSPEAAAELDAFLERDGAHGMVALAAMCDTIEPIQQRLARLTSDAADPASEAARLIGRTLGSWEGLTTGGETALVAASGTGNTPVLLFFLAQPGVSPESPAQNGTTPLTAATVVREG